MVNIFRVGDKSPRVAEARVALARLGLLKNFSGSLGKNSIHSDRFSPNDEYFDQELSTTLKAFQQSRGIRPSGVIDEGTLRELRQASYKFGARVLNYEPANQLIGDDVAHLQTQLQELGFYQKRIDGHFGEDTYHALINYQLNSGLKDDGICGPETIHALKLLGRRIRGGSPDRLIEMEQVRSSGPMLAGKRVVIDPALGGSNRGVQVHGPYGSIYEEEIIWDIATRVEGRMIAANMETILSRPRMADPSHIERADIANTFKADLMISLELDHYKNEKASGVATFYYGSHHGSSSLLGEKLSGFIQREIVARTGMINDATHGRTWDLLRLTTMPTVQISMGYMTNPDDVAKLTDPRTRDVIADAIVVAVKRLYLMDQDTEPTGTYNFAKMLEDGLA